MCGENIDNIGILQRGDLWLSTSNIVSWRIVWRQMAYACRGWLCGLLPAWRILNHGRRRRRYRRINH